MKEGEIWKNIADRTGRLLQLKGRLGEGQVPKEQGLKLKQLSGLNKTQLVSEQEEGKDCAEAS